MIRYIWEGFLFILKKEIFKDWGAIYPIFVNHFSFRVSIFQITGELIFLDQMIAKIMHNSQIFDNRIRLITTTLVIWANFISIKLFQHVKTISDFPCQFWWWIRKMLWSRVNVRLIKLALLFKGVYAALRLTASSTHCRLVEVIKSASMSLSCYAGKTSF